MNNEMDHHLKSVVNFFFEVGILAKTPRSGFHFLRSGGQSVAEHTHRTVHIGYMLAMLSKDVSVEKVMKMCLFHDFAEGRTGDLNYVHQKYVRSDEIKAMSDVAETLKFDHGILDTLQELKSGETQEAKLTRDADQIEFLLSLKEELDAGNIKAKMWMPAAVNRIKTEIGKKVAQSIVATHSDEWWSNNAYDDSWWNGERDRKGRW